MGTTTAGTIVAAIGVPLEPEELLVLVLDVAVED